MKTIDHVPTISLITVCFNSSATIGKTIESVLAQKDSGVEYVIVDGASTDGTQDIIRSYQGIDLVVSEPDQGIADAFNKGIQLASGDIIGLINSDDQLCQSALVKARQYFVGYPDVEVIHGDVLLHEEGRAIKRIKPSGRWWYPWRLVLFNHPATFVRREVYRKYGLFDVSYQIAMDVEMYLRWVSRGVKIRYFQEVLVNMQTGGASGQSAVKGCREVCRAALWYGYPPVLVYLQLFGKVALLLLLKMVSKFRGRIQTKTNMATV